MPRTIRRKRPRALHAILSMLSMLSMFVAASAVGAQRADAADAPLVIECRIGTVASTVLEARVHAGVISLPLRPVLALAGLDSSAATGERSIGELEALFHAAVTFDSAALVVQIADSGSLPVSMRALRASARARLATNAAEVAASERSVAPSATSPALDVSYAIQRDGTVSMDAELRAAGGIAELATSRAPGVGLRSTLSWSSMPARLLGGVRLRVGAAGELRGHSGMVLTNAPIVRDDVLRVSSIRDPRLSGSELELFDDGILVAADSVGHDGDPRIGFPARRGVHEMRLVAYDSAGRARETRWVDYVPDALLPRGELRYAIGARACMHASCADPVVQVEYAPDDWVTIGVRVAELGRRRDGRGSEASASLDARLAASSVLSMHREADGSLSAQLRVERGRAQATVLRVDRGTSSPLALSAPVSLSSATGAPAPSATAAGSWRVGTEGSFDIVTRATGRDALLETSAGTATSIGTMRASVAVVRGAVRCASVAGAALLRGASLPNVLAALRSAALTVRAEHRAFGCGDASTGALGVLLPALRWTAFELTTSWARARGSRGRVAISLALRRRLGGVIDTHAEVAGGAPAATLRTGVSGAFVLDALRRSVSLAAPSAGVSGVEGIVFDDENANGRRDQGEQAIADAVVRVGDASAVTDEHGIFVVRGIPTDRMVRVVVDSLSVDGGGYVPAAPIMVLLVSRAIVRVDVPVRPSGG